VFVHIVIWRLKESANGKSAQENALEMRRRFEALRGVIPDMPRLDLGIDVSRGEQSADVALYTEFTSSAAHDVYQAHPAHLEIVAFVKTVVAERRVVDYEL
jgi:hypothetical protein